MLSTRWTSAPGSTALTTSAAPESGSTTSTQLARIPAFHPRATARARPDFRTFACGSDGVADRRADAGGQGHGQAAADEDPDRGPERRGAAEARTKDAEQRQRDE